MQKHLIVIAGPTASGKTSLGIELAQRFNTVILSADSRQFYKEMNIGTAKPDEKELAAAKHYFIDNLSINDEYSAGDYEKEAILLLDELFQKHDKVLLVGGSGLFIKAVLEGLDEFPDVPLSVRDKYIDINNSEGIQVLQKELEEKDPEYFKQVDINNPHRIIRALSVIAASGKPFSSFRNQQPKKRNFKPIIIKLNWERQVLYDRINLRVDLMLKAGLIAEAKSLYPKKHLNSLQTVGYQELFDCFDGNITEEKAIELIKRNSRRYAKRQTTWLRKIENAQSFHPSELSSIISHIEELTNQ